MPSQRLHQIEQSPVDKQGLLINDVVSILAHVHPSDTIRNETRRTRQRVSVHQQSNGGSVGPRRGVKLYAVQSATVIADYVLLSRRTKDWRYSITVTMKFGFFGTTISRCTVDIRYPVKLQISNIEGTGGKKDLEKNAGPLTSESLNEIDDTILYSNCT
ncbi:hypothetical protein AVEN_49320-1 [Araneus ventricosus]|uniref:Uncharacterized protein n=1 Tax=Araneus ventricosus TaxID=182803 RepID=A0A4Y2X8E7_ARAVE|nr:hypothetical protein AVEN_49320-1 [Araneus ventricosus]